VKNSRGQKSEVDYYGFGAGGDGGERCQLSSTIVKASGESLRLPENGPSKAAITKRPRPMEAASNVVITAWAIAFLSPKR
jgi:hypothetical protein